MIIIVRMSTDSTGGRLIERRNITSAAAESLIELEYLEAPPPLEAMQLYLNDAVRIAIDELEPEPESDSPPAPQIACTVIRGPPGRNPEPLFRAHAKGAWSALHQRPLGVLTPRGNSKPRIYENENGPTKWI